MEERKDGIEGPRCVIRPDDERFPVALRFIPKPPKQLFVIGDARALQEGLAVIGARKATPYGKGCAMRFSRMAAERGIVIISGGARGCDTHAHEAALEAGGRTVAFLGGGCDCVYPPENLALFRRIVAGGGAIVSEQDWARPPMPWMFRERNRLIAGLARATLIVEAGLPSGTFSTADEALAASRDVLVVPGAITSARSRGANRLIYQGATPVVDDDTFYDQLFMLFGCLKQEDARSEDETEADGFSHLLGPLSSQALTLDELMGASKDAGGRPSLADLMLWLTKQTRAGHIAQYPDGRYGPA